MHGYHRSKATDLHKHFCGEWLVMCGGVGIPRVEGVEHVEGFGERTAVVALRLHIFVDRVILSLLIAGG